MALDINELRQQLGATVKELRDLQEDCDKRGGETAEDREKFDKMEAAIVGIEKRIKNEEFLSGKEAELARSARVAQNAVNGKGHANGEGSFDGTALSFDAIRYGSVSQRAMSRMEYEEAVSLSVQGFLRMSKPGGVLEQRHINAGLRIGIPDLRASQIDLPIIKDYRSFQREFRVGLDTITSTEGKETIPQGFVYSLEQALLAYGGVRSVATVIRTDSGNALPYPTMNDTSNKGAILSEATTIGASVDPAFAQLTLNAFKYSSKPILMSYELTQDSAFDLGALVGDWLGTRIARIQNDHFTTGAGTTLPKGLTIAAVLGKAAASMTAIISDEVIDLIHSVDPAYRPNASFMMHDVVLAAIRKLKEQTTNAYIWQPGLQAGVPDRLLGYRYTVNQSMSSTFTTGQKLVLFGDLSKYLIRDVSTIRLVRLEERYADTDQIAFIAFMRTDGNLLDAGTRPVKWLALA
jgi:HK97 family phage major capsid protein